MSGEPTLKTVISRSAGAVILEYITKPRSRSKTRNSSEMILLTILISILITKCANIKKNRSGPYALLLLFILGLPVDGIS